MYVPKLIVCLRDYSWRQFRRDAAAGAIVGLVALPLAMAFSSEAVWPISSGCVSET